MKSLVNLLNESIFNESRKNLSKDQVKKPQKRYYAYDTTGKDEYDITKIINLSKTNQTEYQKILKQFDTDGEFAKKYPTVNDLANYNYIVVAFAEYAWDHDLHNKKLYVWGEDGLCYENGLD